MQDKENKQTPSTAYVSSRLGLASPAFETPARTAVPTHTQTQEEAATKSVPSRQDAHAHSTPSAVTAFAHITPPVTGSGHSTPTSEAASGDTVLPLRAFGRGGGDGGDKAKSHLSHPAHCTPLLTVAPDSVSAAHPLATAVTAQVSCLPSTLLESHLRLDRTTLH